MNERQWKFFYEIYEDLPRQGPGDRASTLRALAMLNPLTSDQRILDIGCGTGAQTLDLAGATQARIVAVDNHPPFVARLVEHSTQLGVDDRVDAQVGDMGDLQFPDQSFDVVWSEGAVFIIGFSSGLASWRRLLKPGGHMVISELCWFEKDPHAEVRRFLADEGADITDTAARREAVSANGYRLLCDFALPSSGWWENYYLPLAERLDHFEKEHAGDPDALAVSSRSRHEIDLYRRHPGAFGYVFFVMILPVPTN